VTHVLHPRPEELAALLRQGFSPTPLLVRSGGTSSRAIAPGHWTLDLARHFTQLTINDDGSMVTFGTGLTMGTVQEQLAHHGRSLPSGLSSLPGAGYVLTGGISPLSRSQGLAIDRVSGLAGVWANGEPFDLKGETDGDTAQWRGLLGAAPFLGVVSSISLHTTPLRPLKIARGLVKPAELSRLIQAAESWPDGLSLQWLWADRIEVLLVATADDPIALERLETWQRQGGDSTARQCINLPGLLDLPPFGTMARIGTPPPKGEQEVLGLLGGDWSQATPELINGLQELIAKRPDPRCALASQQLGGCSSRMAPSASSFVHRQAIWKPWITAGWPAGDQAARRNSLLWLEQVRDHLLPLCPGVHLAQLHDHLSWHEWEVQAAFRDWLPGLRRLKEQHDPYRLLPPL